MSVFYGRIRGSRQPVGLTQLNWASPSLPSVRRLLLPRLLLPLRLIWYVAAFACVFVAMTVALLVVAIFNR